MLRGRLLVAENRCRFLESKQTSHESKICRLEATINNLEQQTRRQEGEQRQLRLQCEQLEKALLFCQVRYDLCAKKT